MTTIANVRCVSCRDTEWEVASRSDPTMSHTVRFSHYEHKYPELGPGYSCTCKAYIYHEGDCWHIRQAIAFYCGWIQQLDHTAPTETDACPRCGEETVSEP